MSDDAGDGPKPQEGATGGRDVPAKEGARFHTSSESSNGEEVSESAMEGLVLSSGEVKQPSPIKKKARDSSVPTPLGLEGSFGVVPESPPRFVSLDQIMKTADGMTNMALAHEIAMEDSFELKQKEYPQNSLEQLVKETLCKAFWRILEEELNEDPPNYTQAMRLLQEAKEDLDYKRAL
ncbi:hypothetical protein HPB50_021803 [Hyalomma asiaticum]|uniref:Uncharacterized protein n=1 Tax=Hyalomma asiaticum TaxID=266040 RepID=A0ACB7RNX1_HYAAI|nr:hypothetical protein HPB50_021803 [Hyalomma asiaticum]